MHVETPQPAGFPLRLCASARDEKVPSTGGDLGGEAHGRSGAKDDRLLAVDLPEDAVALLSAEAGFDSPPGGEFCRPPWNAIILECLTLAGFSTLPEFTVSWNADWGLASFLCCAFAASREMLCSAHYAPPREHIINPAFLLMMRLRRCSAPRDDGRSIRILSAIIRDKLQVSAYSPQAQAGSLCYSASVFHLRVSVAEKISHRRFTKW